LRGENSEKCRFPTSPSSSPQLLSIHYDRRMLLICSTYTISEKAIRFRYPDYNPDRGQTLTSSSMSRYLSTCNISSKSMHVFLSNLANRLSERQTNTGKNIYSSFVGGNNNTIVRFSPLGSTGIVFDIRFRSVGHKGTPIAREKQRKMQISDITIK